MKKLFTLAAALLASFSLWAQTTLATFEVTLTADPTSAYASYSDDDATYTCSKVGSNSSSNFYKASNDKYYLKLTGDDGYVQIKLKDGNFAADDTVFYALNHSQKKTGIGFKFSKSSATTTVDMTAAGTEVIGKYALKAADIEDDGSIKMYRASSNTFVNKIYVIRANAAPITDPVATVTIAGPTEAATGYAAEYTATTDVKADAYQWFVDGVAQDGATKKTFEFTPAVKGATYAIVCKARNANNATDEWIASNTINVTGTKLCGELFKATTQGTVTGVVGGTYDTNNGTGATKKLDKSKYYGVKLANGSFMAGDVFTINVTTAANTEGSKFMLYADKEGTDLIVDAGSEGYLNVTGELTVTLPAAANGKNSIYLYRENGNTQWNPTFDWFSVTRSCEDSNDATIHSLTVNGNEVAENDGLFEYTLSSSYEEPTVTIAFEIHPLATIKYGLSNPYELTTPDLGGSRGQAFTIIAEDGTEKTYTVQIYKSASLSNDATLKELSVEGFNLNVEFDPEVLEYSIFKDYSAEYPAETLITATPNDDNAKSVDITFNEGVFTIVVTAEDETTTKTYTITVNSRLARKDLLRTTFSNGAIGFIAGYTIHVPYIAGEEAPTFVSATFWNPEGNATAEMLGDQLKVTGIDGVYNLFTIEPIAISPMVANYDEITFDTVPDYIYTIYGWDAEKGVKFSKDAEEASNHRISEGKDRICLALPAAKELILTSGSGAERPVSITVNGVASSVTKTAKKNETITIELDGTKNNFVSIESNGSNGDGGFTKMQLIEAITTAIDNTNDEVKAVKIIRDGQLFIEKNGVLYNAQGAVVK